MSKKQTEPAEIAEHTPGPWSIHDRAKTAVVDSSGIVVAACGSHSNNLRDAGELEAEQQANAHLIAAAPELLAALQHLRDAFIGTSIEVQADAMRNARAAIAKATGVKA